MPNNINHKYNLYNKKYSRIEFLLFLMLFIFMLTSCNKEPIKIGFIGDLSSKNAQLAIDARNAVELGVKLINEDGGVKGRNIELIVKDDFGDLEEALVKHKAFVGESVKFVIGHMNSNMAPAILESADVDLMFISPSMSTTTLSKKDDFFLRSAPINDNQASLFAEYAISQGLEDIVIIYDLMNEQYTRTVAEGVELIMKENNQPIKKMIDYDTRSDDLYDIAQEIIDAEPKNVLVIAQASDSAYLIQNVKQTIIDLGSFSVSWSMTKDFISNGGKNVEGTIFVGVYMPEILSEDYINFANAFEENYGYEISFIGVLAYDALNVLVEGMKKSDEIEPLAVKKSIIEIESFKGLYNDFNIDLYGDNDKEYMMYELNKGEFIPLRDWKD